MPISSNDLKIENRVYTGQDMAEFWSLTNPSGPQGAWEWMGKRDKAGYGIWKGLLVHRIMYYIAHGELPAHGRVVAHMCFVKHCVNPRHLQDCTKGQNNRHADQWKTMPNGYRLNTAQWVIKQNRVEREGRKQ